MPAGRRRQVLLISLGTVLVAAGVVVLPVVPGLVWEGTAVWEPCERRVEERFGEDSGITVLRDETHVDWWPVPPRWVCPLSNGDAVRPR